MRNLFNGVDWCCRTHSPMSRETFRQSVFDRDNNQCVFCASNALDAHHIVERRLFGPCQGYHLDNGASVCGSCHMKAETTEYSVEQVRAACGITTKVLPPHLYDDQAYDKWGNPIVGGGMRLKGELFHDHSVQKVLAQGKMLGEFSSGHWVRYPRTYHVPWSDNLSDDDRMLETMDSFANKQVVVTVKMDGANTSCYEDCIHGRTVGNGSDDKPVSSRVKQIWYAFRSDIPEKWRVCGEDLVTARTVKYDNLESYFLGFSIWSSHNICLSWKDTLEWFGLLGITPVTVLYEGLYDEKKIKSLYSSDVSNMEGYVIRVADEFEMKDFRRCVGKYVRPKFKYEVVHGAKYIRGPEIPNSLAEVSTKNG